MEHMAQALAPIVTWAFEAPDSVDVCDWREGMPSAVHVVAGPMLDRWGAPGAAHVSTGLISVYRHGGF